MKRASRIAWASLVAIVTSLGVGHAADTKAVVAELKKGGCVIVMRHGATNPEQSDEADPMNPDVYRKERDLSDEGREQAKQVGKAFRKLGIPFGTVYTSKLHRAVETGQLVSGGEVVPTIDLTLNVTTPEEHDRRNEALKKLIATPPAAGKNTLIVSHGPNIIDALGIGWSAVKEGEISFFRFDSSGKPELLDRVQAADWIKAADEP